MNDIYLDIGLSLMRSYIFNRKGDYIVKDFEITQKLTPGALTVFICEAIESIDSDHLLEGIIIAFPGDFDDETNRVNSFLNLSGWLNIPLIDWLEIRLQKKIKMIKKDSFALMKDPTCFFR